MSFITKLTKKYLWWTERERLAIVEYDTDPSCMESPTAASAGKRVRLLCTRRGIDLDGQMTTVPELPPQFHEALAFKAISLGYLRGDSTNPQLAQYFEGLYREKVKEAKKYAKAGHITFGNIKPVDF